MQIMSQVPGPSLVICNLQRLSSLKIKVSHLELFGFVSKANEAIFRCVGSHPQSIASNMNLKLLHSVNVKVWITIYYEIKLKLNIQYEFPCIGFNSSFE